MHPRSEMNHRQWLDLKDRALAVSAEGITIADARQPGRPLIYVNEGFERLTGYSASDALGHNCKFLQGQGSDPQTVEHIRRALRNEEDCTVEILNYRKDGTPFWNRLSITPVRNADGVVSHYIGIQSDVTKRRQAEEALHEANEQLALINATMQRELDEAARIQRAWLPQSLPKVPGYRFAWSFTPCQELGGDSLNVLRLDPYHVGMYVLDVTGHGVGAALLSASIQRGISDAPESSCLYTRRSEPGSFEIASPATVATRLNREFQLDPKSGKFFTLLYGVLDTRNGEFRYVTAGHMPPLRAGASGTGTCPHQPCVPIGVMEEFEFCEARLQLQPGDRLLLYTDGASEATDDEERMYGTERLLHELERQRKNDPDEALAVLMDGLRKWTGSHALEDDITLLMVDATGPDDGARPRGL